MFAATMPAEPTTGPASLARSPLPSSPDRSSAALPPLDARRAPAERPEPDGSPSRKRLKSARASQSRPSPPGPTGHPKPVVEFDRAKPCFSLKQNPLELCDVSNMVKKDLVRFTEELESRNTQVDHFPVDHLKLIARLVHESDKPLADLAQYIHAKVLPLSRLEDDEGEKRFDPLPLSVLESAIEHVAKRVNYGIQGGELDWLPDELLQKKFGIWRWESHDRESVIPVDLKEKYEKRWADRQLVKGQMLEFLSRMSVPEREALVKKLDGPSKRKSKGKQTAIHEADSNPSASKDQPSVQKPCTSLQDNQQGQLKAPTEKQLAKMARDQKKKEKEDAKQAVENAQKKMGNLMSGWISKGTPAAEAKPKPNLGSLASPKQVRIQASCSKADFSVVSGQEPSKLSDFHRVFRPFNLKANVSLAPHNRFSRTQDEAQSQADIEHVPDLTLQRSLHDFISAIPPMYKSNLSRKAPRVIPTRDIVNGLAENEISGNIEGAKRWRRMLKNRCQVPVKYLRFHEDARPGYVGTWSKTSRLVTGRTPFGRDTCLLDYEYDSEAEWGDDDIEGEDLAASDDNRGDGAEESQSELAEESDEDGWLVGDDDEIEMIDDGQMHSSNRSLDAQNEEHTVTKQTTKIKGHGRRRIVGPMIPVVKGPMWEQKLGAVEAAMFEPYRIQFINDARVGLDPFTFVSKTSLNTNRLHSSVATDPHKHGELEPIRQTALPMPLTSTSNQVLPLQPLPSHLYLDRNLSQPAAANHKVLPSPQVASAQPSKRTNKPFPIELVPRLISIVNGNRKAKPLLIEDLRVEFLEHRVSKAAIEKKLSDVAVKVGGVWRIVEAADVPMVVN